jgi:nicotinate dehydrogenase subunit B
MNAEHQTFLSRRLFLAGTSALVIGFSLSPVDKILAAGEVGKPALLPTELDSWLAIAKDGSVTVFFGKIDGGQGTDLAMAQIVAEELDVPIKSVSVIEGDTALTINQGGASGSTGVRFAGAALRVAGAEARRVLVSKAAEKLGVPAESLTVTDGVVSLAGNAAKSTSYAELIGGEYFHSEIGWNKQFGNPLALTSPLPRQTQIARSI